MLVYFFIDVRVIKVKRRGMTVKIVVISDIANYDSYNRSFVIAE